jgi:NAD(P)H-dependent FMN reductase
MNILCILGSNDENSINAVALETILTSARLYGATAQILDLRQTSLPLLNPTSKDTPENFQLIRSLVLQADAFVLATPDYHGSMSGMLKNFLDYFWMEFAGKLFGYICSSFDKGLTAMDHVRTCIRQCYGWSLPYGVSFSEKDFVDGILANSQVEERLQMFTRDIVVYGSLLHEQRTRDMQGNDDVTFMAKYRSMN